MKRKAKGGTRIKHQSYRHLVINHKIANASVSIPIFAANNFRGDNPLFILSLQGVTLSDICAIPTGGEIVKKALRKLKLNPDDYWTSFWFASEGG